jgi:gluconolactonase
MSDDLSAILDGEPERISTGFIFTEGPLWHPDGFLYFVDIRRRQLLRWVPGRQAEVLQENTSEANGLTFDLQGRLITCEGGNRRVTRTEQGGTTTALADRWEGKRLNRPNDVVGRSDGSVYFTDPGGRVPPEEREIGFSGVFRVDPDGQLHLATDECEYPNGLAFSPDESILYVAISRLDARCLEEEERGEVCTHRKIRAFDVAPDGTLSNNRVFADMSSAEEGVPDGMKVDTQGQVFCTGNGGTCVFDKDGRLLGTIVTPEVPANCAFGGSDGRTLFLTARTSLYSVRVKTPGVKVPRAA